MRTPASEKSAMRRPRVKRWRLVSMRTVVAAQDVERRSAHHHESAGLTTRANSRAARCSSPRCKCTITSSESMMSKVEVANGSARMVALYRVVDAEFAAYCNPSML
jgi:hypothetical protein